MRHLYFVRRMRREEADKLEYAIDRLRGSRQSIVPDTAEMVDAMATMDSLPPRIQVCWGTKEDPNWISIDKLEAEVATMRAELDVIEKHLR